MVAATVNQTYFTKYRALKLPQKRNKIEFLKTLRLFSEIHTSMCYLLLIAINYQYL